MILLTGMQNYGWNRVMQVALVQKTFRLVELLATEELPDVSLGRLADRAGLPKPTAHRILQTLASLGYVQQNGETKGYRLGSRFLRLTRNDACEEVRRTFGGAVERLHDLFDETVNLAVLEEGWVRYAVVRETTRALRWVLSPSAVDPFHTTALGQVLAAHLPEDDVERLMAGEGTQGVRMPNREELRTRLKQVRRRGWALDDEENEPGVVCLAVPLYQGDQVGAALSVTLPKVRFQPELKRRLLQALQQESQQTKTEDRI